MALDDDTDDESHVLKTKNVKKVIEPPELPEDEDHLLTSKIHKKSIESEKLPPRQRRLSKVPSDVPLETEPRRKPRSNQTTHREDEPSDDQIKSPRYKSKRRKPKEEQSEDSHQNFDEDTMTLSDLKETPKKQQRKS